MSWLLMFCRGIEILVCCYVIVSFIPKSWKRIRAHAEENIKNLKKFNHMKYPKTVHHVRINKINDNEGKVTMLAKQWEDGQMLTLFHHNVIDTNTLFSSSGEFESNLNLNNLGWSQMSNNLKKESNYFANKRTSLTSSKEESLEESDREISEEPCDTNRRRSTVSEITKMFEDNETKVKVHMASKAYQIPGNYFEGMKGVSNGDIINNHPNNKQHKMNINNEDKPKSETGTEITINKANSSRKYFNKNNNNNNKQQLQTAINHHLYNHEDNQKNHNNHNHNSYSSSTSNENNTTIEQFEVIKNENCSPEANEALQKNHIDNNSTTAANDDDDDDDGNRDEKQIIKEENSSKLNGIKEEKTETEKCELNVNGSCSLSTSEASLLTLSSLSSSSPPPSLEVKFRNNHEKVQSIEEILKQQRFSRRLSAYSISEFLKDFPNEIEIDEIINDIHVGGEK